MTTATTVNIGPGPSKVAPREPRVLIRVGEDRWVQHNRTIVPPDGEFIWPLADDYDVNTLPRQGGWTTADYLKLDVAKLVEFTDGRLEFLPVATETHQEVIAFLFMALRSFVQAGSLGTVLFAPMRMYVGPESYREPDVLFMFAAHAGRRSDGEWKGADLVMEIVSKHDPKRDYQQKRQEYAAAGVGEYWVVDPVRRTILLLALDGGAYREVGTFGEGGRAASVLLPGFGVDVVEVFAAVPK